MPDESKSRKYTPWEQIIEKILPPSERRDISNIESEENFDLSNNKFFKELQDYFKEQDLKKNPLNITNSKFKHLNAKGIYLPYTKGTSVNLWDSNLEGAIFKNAEFVGIYLHDAKLKKINFENADLSYAFLGNACLEDANLKNVNLEGAEVRYSNFKNANFKEANLKNVDFRHANLEGANLISVKNLENSLNLKFANLKDIKTTSREDQIIKEVLLNGKFTNY